MAYIHRDKQVSLGGWNRNSLWMWMDDHKLMRLGGRNTLRPNDRNTLRIDNCNEHGGWATPLKRSSNALRLEDHSATTSALWIDGCNTLPSNILKWLSKTLCLWRT